MATPELGFIRVVSMLIVVLFPAPFGPRKPKISPTFISKLTLSTAFIFPKDFERFSTLTIRSLEAIGLSASWVLIIDIDSLLAIFSLTGSLWRVSQRSRFLHALQQFSSPLELTLQIQRIFFQNKFHLDRKSTRLN